VMTIVHVEFFKKISFFLIDNIFIFMIVAICSRLGVISFYFFLFLFFLLFTLH
jgi:hypothetical protein